MKPKGVNRVVIAVEDLDEAVALYSELLATTFHCADALGAPLGIRGAISWDAGIEIVSPLPQSDSPMGRAVRQFIEEHGGGLYSVVFSVDDVDEAFAKVKEMDIRVTRSRELDQEEIGQFFQGKFRKFKQHALKAIDTCGVRVVLGQLEPK